MEQRVETSRGDIIIRDDHTFEIIVPVDGQLVLSFQGENISFRVKNLLDNAKETWHNGAPNAPIV